MGVLHCYTVKRAHSPAHWVYDGDGSGEADDSSPSSCWRMASVMFIPPTTREPVMVLLVLTVEVYICDASTEMAPRTSAGPVER